MLSNSNDKVFEENVYPYYRVENSGVIKRGARRQKTKYKFNHFLNNLNLFARNIIKGLALPVFKLILDIITKIIPKEFFLTDFFHLIAVGILARGVMLGELLPFGGAYLAASLVFRPDLAGLLLLSAVIGFLSTSLIQVFWSQVGIVLLITSIITSIRKKSEQWWIPLPFLVMLTYLLVHNCFLAWQGWNLYQEISIIFEAIMAGILAFIFMVVIQRIENPEPSKLIRSEEMMAGLVLGACLILGISDIQIGGLAISPAVAALGVLVMAYLGGAGIGSACGALLGLLPSVTHLVMPYAVGVYAISGLLAGMLRGWGRLGMVLGFVLGNLLLTLYLAEGGTGPESLMQLGGGVVLFLLFPNQFLEHLGAKIGVDKENPKKGFLTNMFSNPFTSTSEVIPVGHDFEEEQKLEEGIGISAGNKNEPVWWKVADQRLRNLSEMLNEISCVLERDNELGEKNSEQILMFFESIRDGFCQNCKAYQACWEENFYNTCGTLLDLLSLKETEDKKGLDSEKILFRMKNYCLYSRELINYVNQIYEKFKLENYWQSRMQEGRMQVSRQIKNLAGAINNVAFEFSKKAERVKNLEKKISYELKNQGIEVKNLVVYQLSNGELEIYLRCMQCSLENDSWNRIVQALSVRLGRWLEIRSKCYAKNNESECEICLVEVGGLFVEVGVAWRVEDGGDCSGDNYLALDLPGNKYLLALSDGMGSGQEAYLTSKLTLGLLKRALCIGLNPEQAVQAINSLMLLRSKEERFATIDLVLIDLKDGVSDFLKLGAPSSFLKRGSKIKTITSESPPVGILDSVETCGFKYQLHSGDILVMVTDGLLDSRFHITERDTWLYKTLEKMNYINSQRLADAILARALANSPRVRDDMAVLVARVKEREV